MASSQQHRCVFVGNIPYDATEEQLIQICEEVGPVVSFRLVIDRETGKPKGYGFCEYKDEETALSARRNLQGYEINGRQLRVDFAENDKGADRNRDQGRGGPGLSTNADAQKQVVGPVIVGDTTSHQPIGLPIAMTAASVMSGALGGPQTGQMIQNGLQIGNDPLTHHLAKMSRSQLNQVLHQMKMLSMQNKDLARQLLLVSPQLPKALFQAQIILGMVTPQMLQMPSIRQQSPNQTVPAPQPSLQPTMQGQPPSIPALPGLPSFTPLPSVTHNPLVHNQFSAPLPHHPQLRAQHPNPNQMVAPSQSTMPAHSGPSSLFSARPQPLGGLQMPPVSSSSSKPVQPPPLQHAGQAASTAYQNSNVQATIQNHPASSDPGSKAVSSARPASVEVLKKDVLIHAQSVGEASLVSGTNTVTKLALLSDRKDSRDPMVHPSKLMKLDNGRVASSFAGSAAPSSIPIASSSTSASQSPSLEAQNVDNQASQLQLTPDVESALLQQVLNLTPEQLSSLPLEQQQQVIELQQMLR